MFLAVAGCGDDDDDGSARSGGTAGSGVTVDAGMDAAEMDAAEDAGDGGAGELIATKKYPGPCAEEREDVADGTVNARTSWTYDGNGNMLTEQDEDADGTVNRRRTHTSTPTAIS